MTTANINVRTDLAIKTQAQQIFESIGLDLSTAINLFLKQTVKVKNLPFVIGMVYSNPDEPPLPKVRNKPLYGCAKDKIWMADDFDAPLDDFEDYM